MDIKKSDSPIHNSAATPVTRQMGESSNQTKQQPNPLDLKASFVSQIKTGQQLELLVIKLTEHDAILEILGSKTQVRTADKDLLQVGQRLKAQITSTEPIIQLKVLTSNSNQSNKIQSLINSTLRQTMPMQQPIKNLLESIQQIGKINFPANSSLQTIKESFIQSIPPSQAFEAAEVLPEIFKRSGIFTEHLLKNIIHESNQKMSFPNNDLKIALLRLASNLRSMNSSNINSTHTITDTLNTNTKLPTSTETYSLTSIQQHNKINTEGVNHRQVQTHIHANTENTKLTPVIYTQEQLIDKLLNQTEGALARLQTLQLQHIQPNEAQKSIWSFELPLRTETSLDNIFIYIEEDDSGNEKNQYTSPWKVILKFNINELGAIQAHITMQGTKVSVNFWVENASTSQLFSEHLSLLDSQLSKAGLESDKLNCHCDTPPTQPKPQIQLINETL